MNQQNQTIKRSGFVYSRGTKKGFLRMQHLGIPKPPFRIEDKLTRRLSKIYKAYITKLILDFIQKAKESNANFENGKIVSDGADKIEKALKNAEKSNTNTSHSLIENKVAVQNVLFQLENAWKPDFFLEFMQTAKIEDLIDKSLTAGIDDFSKKILEDSSDKMSEILTSFSIDKKEVFAQNMANLKKLYIDDSLKRIQGESDFLKKTFLEKLTDYIQGNSDTFDIATVVKSLNQSSAKGARFFARDQMQKFNKAQTLATFSSAGVKTIKWCTCRDVRVRQSHKDLDGKIFPITDLPKEINDYNCRCGLVPVEYYDDDFVGDSAFVSDSDFDESEHKRDEKGRFAEKEERASPKEKFIKSSTNENIKELSDVKSNEDLINYFFNKHGVDEVNDRIQFMDTECIVEFMKGFESLQQEFPQVKLKSIGKTSTGASYNFGGVLSFSDMYRDKSNIQKEIDENIKNGYWIKNASIETLARHEFGHAFEELLIRNCGKYKTEDEMIEAWDNCTEAKSILNEAYENLRKQGETKTLYELREQISQYSLDNESETIAECIAIPDDKIDKKTLPYEIKSIILKIMRGNV